ncbi:MAG: lysophospholipase [Tunicatimonas sp.]
MAYQHRTQILVTTTDSLELFWQKWLPEGTVERVVVFQHGMGEHSGRYQHLLDAFDNTGTAFYALDARGHGRSPGRQGYLTHFERFADDLGDLIQIARSENDERPVFLLGHSLGGVIALDFALRSKSQDHLRGLVLSSAAIELPRGGINQVLRPVAQLLSRLAPGAILDTMLRQTDLSHDAEAVAAYRADPLVHGKAAVLLGHTLFRLNQRFYAEAHRLTIPVYLFHGTADRITSPEGSKKFFEQLTVDDKTLNLYEGLFHETMNELPADRQKVLSDLREWVLER